MVLAVADSMLELYSAIPTGRRVSTNRLPRLGCYLLGNAYYYDAEISLAKMSHYLSLPAEAIKSRRDYHRAWVAQHPGYKTADSRMWALARVPKRMPKMLGLRLRLKDFAVD